MCPDTRLATQNVSGGVGLQKETEITSWDEDVNHICPTSDMTDHVEMITTIPSSSCLFFSPYALFWKGHSRCTGISSATMTFALFLVMSANSSKHKMWMIFRLNVQASQPQISLFCYARGITYTQIIQLGLRASYTFSLCGSVVEPWLCSRCDFPLCLCGRVGFVLPV